MVRTLCRGLRVPLWGWTEGAPPEEEFGKFCHGVEGLMMTSKNLKSLDILMGKNREFHKSSS